MNFLFFQYINCALLSQLGSLFPDFYGGYHKVNLQTRFSFYNRYFWITRFTPINLVYICLDSLFCIMSFIWFWYYVRKTIKVINGTWETKKMKAAKKEALELGKTTKI